MDASFILSLVGISLTAVGLLVAAVQTVRLRELRRRTNMDVWLAIRSCKAIIGKLETSESLSLDRKVAEAYAKATELFCQVLKMAAGEERPFTEATIANWRAAGKLNTDWQVAQARQFLQTREISPYRKAKETSPN